MIILAIEHSDGLKFITLNYVNMEPVEIRLESDDGSFYVDTSGCRDNSLPMAVVVSEQRLADSQYRPDPEILNTLKKKAIEEARTFKKKRMKLVPYRMASRLVSEMLPEIQDHSRRKLVDIVRKTIESHR